MKIRTIEIMGFASTIEALRMPFKKEVRSEVVFNHEFYEDGPDKKDLHFESACFIDFDPKDIALLSSLVLKGSEHAKSVRGIWTTAEINAPRYFWSEMDTYVIGRQPLSSESSMHTILKDVLTEDSFEEGTPSSIINDFIDYVDFVKSQSYDNAEKTRLIKQAMPEGFLQKRVIEFNYQTLRNIYFQRKDHRLKEEWQSQLCGWIKSLPLSNQLITITSEKK